MSGRGLNNKVNLYNLSVIQFHSGVQDIKKNKGVSFFFLSHVRLSSFLYYFIE